MWKFCVTHRAGQANGVVAAHDEIMLAQFFAQALCEVRLCLGVQVLGQCQEAVVVQPCQRMRCGGKRHLAPRFGHQVFKAGVAVALAQAQGAADLDEEQATRGLRLKRVAQLLHHVGARGQAGFRID